MKIIFAVIIGCRITMVITLVPGIFDNASPNDRSDCLCRCMRQGFSGGFGGSTRLRRRR